MGVFKTADGRSLVGIGQQDGNEYSGFAGWRDCVIQLTASGATENSVKYLNAIKDYAIAHNAKGESIMPPNLSVWISNNGVTTAVQADDIAVDGSNVTICGIKWDGTAWDYTDAGKGGGGGGASSLAQLSDVTLDADDPYPEGAFLAGNGEKFVPFVQSMPCWELRQSGSNRYKLFWANNYDLSVDGLEVSKDWVDGYIWLSTNGLLLFTPIGKFICTGVRLIDDTYEIRGIKIDFGVQMDTVVTVRIFELNDYDEQTNTWGFTAISDPVTFGSPLQVTLTPTAADLSGTFTVPFLSITEAFQSGRPVVCDIDGFTGVYFSIDTILGTYANGMFVSDDFLGGTSNKVMYLVSLESDGTYSVRTKVW